MNPPSLATPDLLFVDAAIATPFRWVRGHLRVQGARIAALAAGDPAPASIDPGTRVVDLGGARLAPGFIDTHVHGGGGADVMDATPEAIARVAATHAAGGTTSFMPTTVAAPLEAIEAVLDAHRAFVARPSAGARSLGVHLEGPYLAPSQAGALDPRFMRVPQGDAGLLLLTPDALVRRMTAAPELPGGMALGQRLRALGAIASIGHSGVRGDGLLEAMEHGYTLLTHFYSGMEGVTREHAYRVAGLVEGGYLHDHLWVELIADGSHLPVELLRLIRKVKGADRIVLTTDAMRAAGLGPGTYALGGEEDGRSVIVEDGVAKLPDRSAFAGSVSLAVDLLRTMTEGVGLDLLDALRMVTVNPARMLGLDHRIGRLAVGMDADLVVLGDGLEVRGTLVGGRWVHGEGAMHAELG